jgi:hypothetical protein
MGRRYQFCICRNIGSVGEVNELMDEKTNDSKIGRGNNRARSVHVNTLD